MLRLSLAQMRRSAGRLVAAGIAIAIGTAFVAASLFGGSVIDSTATRSLAASFGDADAIVQGMDIDRELGDELSQLPEVEAAFTQISTFESINFQGRTEFTQINTPPAHEKLEVLKIDTGEMPTALDEIALPGDMMDRLGASIGDKITIPIYSYQEDADGDFVEETTERELVITGTTADPRGAYISYGGAALVTAETQDVILGEDAAHYHPDHIAIAARDGISAPSLKEAVQDFISAQNGSGDVRALTVAEEVENATAQITGETNILLTVVLAFAVIALFVAGLVITNTFQVLVAQRTRQLALLRCVGATRSQVSRSVTIESLILGVIASIAGLALGAALIQGTLTILARNEVAAPLPETITLTPVNILVPIITGTLVTVLAAFSPARAATKVAPLAALRPASAPQVGSKAGKIRLTFSLLGVIGGGALLVLGVIISRAEVMLGFAVAVLGGMASFIGIIIGAVFVIPRVVGFFGRLLGRFTGATTKIATANTVRNPRRTSATATALLIGVTLVTMMSTGAAIARTTINNELLDQFPVDIAIGESAPGAPTITANIGPEIAKLDAVESVVEVDGAQLHATVESGGGVIAESGTDIFASSIDSAAADSLGNNTTLPVTEGEVLIGNFDAYSFGLDTDNPAKTVTVRGPEGEKTLNISGSTNYVDNGLLLNDSDFSTIAGTSDISALWLTIDDSYPAITAFNAVNERLSELTENADNHYLVTGAAAERAMFEQIIDTLLLVVVGLLGVAVVIALIGVANTLSLSVIERRRESALLRALGLTRGRLRRMLAIEAMLITGIGAFLGIVLGLIYGIAGADVLLGEMADGIAVTVPWRDIALVLGVALVAGLLASIMPARSATKTPPVAALAEN